MTCPKCNSSLTRNRSTQDNDDHVLRYRICRKCGYTWKTIELDADMVCKKGGRGDVERESMDSCDGTTPD